MPHWLDALPTPGQQADLAHSSPSKGAHWLDDLPDAYNPSAKLTAGKSIENTKLKKLEASKPKTVTPNFRELDNKTTATPVQAKFAISPDRDPAYQHSVTGAVHGADKQLRPQNGNIEDIVAPLAITGASAALSLPTGPFAPAVTGFLSGVGNKLYEHSTQKLYNPSLKLSPQEVLKAGAKDAFIFQAGEGLAGLAGKVASPLISKLAQKAPTVGKILSHPAITLPAKGATVAGGFNLASRAIGEPEKPQQTLTNAAFITALSAATHRPVKLPVEIPVAPKVEPKQTGKYKYVSDKPLDIKVMDNEKATSKDILRETSGALHEQVLRGNHLADDIRKEYKTPIERDGLTLFREAGGDKKLLQQKLEQYSQDEHLKEYAPAIQEALKIADNQGASVSEMARYYDEVGQFSKETGTINSIRENYANRIYEETTPKGYTKTEIGKQGLNSYTKHKKARVFDTTFDAVESWADATKKGEPARKPKTLDAADLLSVHNEEMAGANTKRLLADDLTRKGIGEYRNSTDIPEGFTAIEGMDKHIPFVADKGKIVELKNGEQAIKAQEAGMMHKVYVVPKGIAKGIKALYEPNLLARYEWAKKIGKYQGLVKTFDLAYSTFHHVTMTLQLFGQTRAGYDIAKNFSKFSKQLDSPSFREAELDFARHTGITSKIEANQDIMRKLNKGDDLVAKTLNLPGVKQSYDLANMSSEWLFGKMQRYFKVADYQMHVAEFLGKNPDASIDAITKAKREIAKETNGAYGGMNWKAIGITPTQLNAMRLTLLAPDWNMSNIAMWKYLGQKGQAGKLSRRHFATAIVGGFALTQMANYFLTGHFTDKNAKGHELDVEVSPNVYVSLYKGAVGDAVKLVTRSTQDGIIGGTARFAQGKLSPFARTGLGLMVNKDYNGTQIYGGKEGFVGDTLNTGTFIAKSALPIPFGFSSGARYAMNEKNKNLPAGLAVSTGLASYMPDSNNKGSVFDKQQNRYEENWLHKLAEPNSGKNETKLLEGIKLSDKKKQENRALAQEELGWYLSNLNGNQASVAAMNKIFSKYNIYHKEAVPMYHNVIKKLNNKELSPLMQKVVGMSIPKRNEFVKTLSAEDKAYVIKEYRKIKGGQ